MTVQEVPALHPAMLEVLVELPVAPEPDKFMAESAAPTAACKLVEALPLGTKVNSKVLFVGEIGKVPIRLIA